jgi:hypothetical protein
MAGARPQKRGGLTSIHVWLIVFVVLWVASTAAVVIMFTYQEQLRQSADQARTQLERVARTAELNQPTIRVMDTEASASRPPRSLVGVMAERLRLLIGWLTGNPEDDLATAEAQWNEVLDRIASERAVPNADQITRGTGLIAALRQMYEWYLSEREARQEALAAREEAVRDRELAQARMGELQQGFAERLDGLQKRVATIAEEKDEFAELKQQQISDLEKTIAARRDELNTLSVGMRRQQDNYEAELQRERATLAQQARLLADYRSPGPEGTNELDIAREPIGHILRVHIDLGRLDGVQLGMPFAVYSFGKRVPVDGRGKATIEVVSVGEYTSECRVVTPPPADDPLVEEDPVGNILLSRNRARKPRFVVVGTFDIDYDGVDDPLGLDKVVAFIERFGGEIVDQLDARTDYLVVGRRPSDTEPPAMRGAARDPTAAARRQRAARDAAYYDQTIRDATLLAVPRLRQDPFFNFVGLELGRDVAQRLTP